MAKFRFSRRVTPTQQASVDERLAEAAKAAAAPATAPPPADTGTSEVGTRPGVSDAAGDRLAAPDLADAADRLGTAKDGATTGSGGASDGGGSGSGGSTIGSIDEARAGLAASDPTGLTAVADQLAARRPVADLTQGPEQQDPFDAIADAQAGLPGSALREGANSLLSDAANRDDGVAGIAEQGSGAVGDGAVPSEAKKPPSGFGVTSGGVAAETDEGIVAATKGNIATDPALAGNPVVTTGSAMFNAGVGKSIAAADAAFHGTDGTPRAAAPGAAAPDGPGVVTTPGGHKFIFSDGSSTVVNRDGTQVERSGNVTRITKPDGSSITQTDNKDGTSTIVETAPNGTKNTTLVGTPSDDSIGDEFRHVSEGLKDRLAPQGGGGDGHTDPVDDGGIGGPATGGGIPDVQGALLGGDPRLGGVLDSPGTSGFRAGLDGLDLSRGAGTIRNPDEEHLGGGLEDDPLDDLGRPGATLGSGSPLTDTAEPAGATAGGADAEDDPISAIGSVELVAPVGGLPGLAGIDRSVFGVVEPVPVAADPAIDGLDAETLAELAELAELEHLVTDEPITEITGSGEADAGASAGSSGLVDPIGLFASSSPIDRSVFGVDRPLLAGFRSAADDDAGGSDDSVDSEDDTADDQP